MHVIIVEANSVTLSIPYDVVGEVVSTSYTTYKPKKYSFVTIIKVMIEWDFNDIVISWGSF